ncbi:Fe-S cluster assembly sulfur transfer protein SufU [Desulfogranum mediterraneum]|uniref:Fe-S cluster assembly sulfur transfer protein SufU n=1 Tax=Desulfogranum mediterraneum TaxID=160661 RepID=UPI000405E340|nr:SUF system NifU family Fe-S cluster assembly protein [Desulfogranum mediterraneum]
MKVESNKEMAELYQAVILDHYKNPRNFRKMDEQTCSHQGFNPLCGDRLEVYLKIGQGNSTIEDISFEGEGCAIFKASASLMTEALKGKNIAAAEQLFEEFRRLLLKQLDPDREPHHLGKLKVFSGIWQFPVRTKCASLAWHTMKAALEGKTGQTKTE